MRTRLDHTRERNLRRQQTDAERRLWYLLRDRRLAGFKFRRQHRIGPFFVDFVCLRARLVIEADGGQHAERIGYDLARTAYLGRRGYRVLRFWNHEVMQKGDAVLLEVLRALEC
jgi:very-short-patch-repair endonuclease